MNAIFGQFLGLYRCCSAQLIFFDQLGHVRFWGKTRIDKIVDDMYALLKRYAHKFWADIGVLV